MALSGKRPIPIQIIAPTKPLPGDTPLLIGTDPGESARRLRSGRKAPFPGDELLSGPGAAVYGHQETYFGVGSPLTSGRKQKIPPACGCRASSFGFNG